MLRQIIFLSHCARARRDQCQLDDGRELVTPRAGKVQCRARPEERSRHGGGRRPRGGGYACEARKPPNKQCLAR